MVWIPLSWLFRGCGIAPSGTRLDKYISMLCVFTLSLSSYVITQQKPDVPMWLNKTFYMAAVVLSRVAVVFTVMYNNALPQNYLRIGRRLANIDRQLPDVTPLENRLLAAEITVIFNFLLSSIFIFLTTIERGILYCICLEITNILTNAPCWQETVLVGMIHRRFSCINDLLERNSRKNTNNFIPCSLPADRGTNPDTQEERSQVDLFQVHSSLQGLTVNIDMHYGFYNLFRFASIFLFCVFTMYDYMVFISQGLIYPDLYRHLTSFALQAINLICQAVVCHACSQEASRTVLIAHRLLKHDSPLSLWEEVGLFSTLAIDNNVQFTIGGIFTLNRALLTNTVLTGLSYLIIAVQLKDIKLFHDVGENVTSVEAVNTTV